MTPTETVLTLFDEARPHLSAGLREDWARLWVPEHQQKLAKRLVGMASEGVPAAQPLPHLAAEITPAWAQVFAPFAAVLSDLRTGKEIRAIAVSEAIERSGGPNLLVLLGQRITPSSLTDARAIPPTRSALMAAAEVPHHPREKLSVAARALAKHAPRSHSSFWGTIKGSDDQKNAIARSIIEAILDGATWWNVFGHFAHDTVYEARLPSGHGVRWGKEGEVLIGFLEPFEVEKRLPSGT